MNRWVKMGVPFLILGGAIVISWGMVASKPKAAQTAVEQPIILVNSFVVSKSDVPIRVSVSGTVEPHTETTLVAEVAGSIIEVSPGFMNGGFFKKGEVIIKIDPRNHVAELKRAEATLVKARTQLSQEQSLADYERGEFEKLKQVSDTVPEISELSFRKAKLAQATADVVAAEAQVIRAQGDVERTEIRMPYDGLIREKRADLGQYVNPGTPLSLVFAVDYAEVRLPLSPAQVSKLILPARHSMDGASTPVSVTTSDADKVWPAELVRTEGTLDTNSRTLYAIARVSDPYGYLAKSDDVEPLRIGAFVDVDIPGRVLNNVVTVERHMLKPGNRIWVIDDEMRIRPRIVEVVYADEHNAYISSGLNSGDRVCITPIDNPLPGTRVRIVDNDNSADA